ncbi:hypothetical protein GE061_000202 [Apolygus lucorum]|uniref:Reverse transcriptase zinc-binding domain-containing protein n=1 Tax=Apolygus lucorum TaxID=248454 RepID=A0A6A4K2J5_APOLU|nr:hypothetical protein GE061_000202 [Apolygus lucorum]
MDEWQRRWSSSAKGRHTFSAWPNVYVRRSQKYIVVDHYVAQFYTGHGDFASKLHGFNLKSSATCTCGGEETVAHVFEACPRYSEARRQWLAVLATPDGSTLWEQSTADARSFRATSKYVHNVMLLKTWPEPKEARIPPPLNPAHAASARPIPGTASEAVANSV